MKYADNPLMVELDAMINGIDYLTPQVDKILGNGTFNELGKARTEKVMDIIFGMKELHNRTHLKCAEWLLELKELLKGTKLWSKVLDSGCLPYSRDAAYDLLASIDWLKGIQEKCDAVKGTKEEASWHQILTHSSTRTLRILSKAEAVQLDEVRGLAEAGVAITEPVARSVVNRSMPVSPEHRKARSEARDKQRVKDVRAHAVEKEARRGNYLVAALNSVRVDLLELDELHDLDADTHSLVESNCVGLAEECIRRMGLENLEELSAFVAGQLGQKYEAIRASKCGDAVDVSAIAVPDDSLKML